MTVPKGLAQVRAVLDTGFHLWFGTPGDLWRGGRMFRRIFQSLRAR